MKCDVFCFSDHVVIITADKGGKTRGTQKLGDELRASATPCIVR